MIFGIRKLESWVRDPTFSRFDTIPECDRQTDTHRHTTTAYTALSIASRGKNPPKLLQAELLFVLRYQPNRSAAGALPQTQLGVLTALL